MKRTHYSCMFVLAALLAASLQAATIPGRWEKVGALSPGSRIIVKWKAGDKLEYLFQGLRDDRMLVSDLTGNPVEIPRDQVQKIQRGIPSNDSVVNGTLLGTVTGAGIMSFFAIGCGGGDDAGKCYASLALTGAAIGAAIGFAADQGVKGHETLYKAPR